MCIQTVLKIKKIYKKKALMEDGRVVLLGPIRHVSPGEHLSVYANIALDRADDKREREIL